MRPFGKACSIHLRCASVDHTEDGSVLVTFFLSLFSSFMSPRSGDWKSKIKVWAGSVPPETSVRGVHKGPLHCGPTWSILYGDMPCVSLCVLISYKDTSAVGLGPTPMALF